MLCAKSTLFFYVQCIKELFGVGFTIVICLFNEKIQNYKEIILGIIIYIKLFYLIFVFIFTNIFSGMLHSGSGHTQVENFMSALEVQGLHHVSMKKRELEVESHVEMITRRSCADAVNEEIELQKKQIRLGMRKMEKNLTHSLKH